jgi:hypothetical protein
MILRTVKVFGDGTRQEYTTNTSAQRGRYLMASNKAQDAARYTLRNVKNGYQYDTPRCNTYPHVGCTTTVTLERGWA